jgi:hypothetical protein
MNINERARFLIMPTMHDGYVSLEKTLRDARETKATGKVKKSSSCCMGQLEALQSGENADLNTLHLSPLEITIHLIEILPPGQFEKQVWEMSSNAERLVSAPLAKTQGVAFYKDKDYESASERFGRAVMLLESVSVSNDVQDAQRERKREIDINSESQRRKRLDDVQRLGHGATPSPAITHEFTETPLPLDTRAMFELLQTSRLNYAACRLKLGDYVTVIKQTSEVIEKSRIYEMDLEVMRKHRIKAYFRRAKAYQEVASEFNKAARDLRECKRELLARMTESEAEEDAAAIRGELVEVEREAEIVDRLIKEREGKEREMYSKIFT